MAGMPGGKESPLDAWAAEVIPRAVVYARTLVARPGDAEEVVHDALCRLLRHKEYDLIADGSKLLFRSITNACINRGKRRRELISLDAMSESGASWAALKDWKPADPAEAAAGRELNAAIQSALTELPAMQRAAVELKSMGYSLEEIAGMLDVSASNAGVLVHRARRALARRLAPYLPERETAREMSYG
jgi:RNA polymerase sigma-70 factor (ECF subfamily)